MPEMNAIAERVRLACHWEVRARKLGNVGPTRSFPDLTLDDFLRAGEAIAPLFAQLPHRGIGATILAAVQESRSVTQSNANLGIILLLAPLVASDADDFLSLSNVLHSVTLSETELIYQAIREASPGGLGEVAEEDVRKLPTVPVVEAMKLAADRDLIARQYATGYQDVFDHVPLLLEETERFQSLEAGIIQTQLHLLARFPDSLIARKVGFARAVALQEQARAILAAGGMKTAQGRQLGADFDRLLRSDGHKLNPGTTADLVAAILYIALKKSKTLREVPYLWDAHDHLPRDP